MTERRFNARPRRLPGAPSTLGTWEGNFIHRPCHPNSMDVVVSPGPDIKRRDARHDEQEAAPGTILPSCTHID